MRFLTSAHETLHNSIVYPSFHGVVYNEFYNSYFYDHPLPLQHFDLMSYSLRPIRVTQFWFKGSHKQLMTYSLPPVGLVKFSISRNGKDKGKADWERDARYEHGILTQMSNRSNKNRRTRWNRESWVEKCKIHLASHIGFIYTEADVSCHSHCMWGREPLVRVIRNKMPKVLVYRDECLMSILLRRWYYLPI